MKFYFSLCDLASSGCDVIIPEIRSQQAGLAAGAGSTTVLVYLRFLPSVHLDVSRHRHSGLCHTAPAWRSLEGLLRWAGLICMHQSCSEKVGVYKSVCMCVSLTDRFNLVQNWTCGCHRLIPAWWPAVPAWYHRLFSLLEVLFIVLSFGVRCETGGFGWIAMPVCSSAAG